MRMTDIDEADLPDQVIMQIPDKKCRIFGTIVMHRSGHTIRNSSMDDRDHLRSGYGRFADLSGRFWEMRVEF